VEEQTVNSTLAEVMALKAQFEKIKGETEEFIVSAKHLSDKGIQEAKELIESAKSNWQAILSGFGSSGITQMFTKAKSEVKKVSKKPAMKAAASKKSATKKTKKSPKKSTKANKKKKK
jgi:hypothetical protein